MKDPRITQLAKNLIHYSTALQPEERILIEATGAHEELVEALVQQAYAAGGKPFVQINLPRVERALLMGTDQRIERARARYDVARMGDMQAYIGLRGGDNAYERCDVPADKVQLHATLYQNPVHSELRVKHTKWVVLRYPTPSMAQLAGMSTEAFEDHYFSVCNLDYSKMDAAMDALCALMDATDRVRIVGPGTDIAFSIARIRSQKCSGHMNIPDGEVYTAPVRDSIEGTITYNAPSTYNGFKFENVCLRFAAGKVVQATANDSARVNQILDTDEGARYVGEFALGVNPLITAPMGDILFDEKIRGSLHFTPGNSYEDADNGNRSAIHWDLVLIQTPEYGGGEIYFDDRLVRKDGEFVLPELACLNPENLV